MPACLYLSIHPFIHSRSTGGSIGPCLASSHSLFQTFLIKNTGGWVSMVCVSASIQYQASSIKYQASSIKYQASSIKYQVSSIKYQVSSIKYQVSSIKYQVSSIKCQVSSIKYQVSSVKYQVSSIKCLRIWFGSVESHRSHFGSRYKLGCCGHASLFVPGSIPRPRVYGTGSLQVQYRNSMNRLQTQVLVPDMVRFSSFENPL